MNASRVRVSVCVLVGLLAGAASALNMETVPVGNPRNAADMRYNLVERPEGYGRVDYTYNIGKYEVTAGQYCEFLNAVAKTDIYGLYDTNMDTAVYAYGCNIKRSGTWGGYTYSVASDWANRPVNYADFWDACRFANWLHNGQPTGVQGVGTTETGAYTLTTDSANNNTVVRNADWRWAVTSEDEWYKAAYYKGGSTNAGYWDYPTRSDTAPGQDIADLSGNNANHSTAPNVYPIDSPHYTTVVGEFQRSDSPYGTFDQGGNVYELNEAVVSRLFRTMRGGAFNTLDYGLSASWRYSGWSPVGGHPAVGFRVVEVPEPAAILLLAVSGLALMPRPRRRSRVFV